MPFLSRLMLFTLAGALAGFFTVFLTDIVRVLPISDSLTVLTPRQAATYQYVGCAFGAFVGMLLAAAGVLSSGNRAQLGKAVLVGAGVGAVAGVLGLNLGMAVFGPLYSEVARTPLHFIGNVIARALGWAFIGALAGTADGWRKMSFRVARNGFLGGLIGGILGGASFEIVPYLLVGLKSGAPSRFIGFVVTGGMIGLFVALVSEWLKEAWVRVELGRNEGRDFLLDRPSNTIGRAELSDIPLYGNPQIARKHAIVAQTHEGYTVFDTGESPLGVRVNGERIGDERLLRSGDRIEIADRALTFYLKSVKAATVTANRDTGRVPGGPTTGPTSYAPPAATNYSPPFAPAPFSSAPGAGWQLLATGGPHAGQGFSLVSGMVLGRDPSVNVALPADTRASRHHARILQDATGWILEDLNSTNGTFVNGQRVTRVTLAPGDTIVVGSTTLEVRG